MVLIGGRACTNVAWYSSYSVDCVIPPGIGSGLDVVVIAGGSVSPLGNKMFSYDKPSIEKIYPS